MRPSNLDLTLSSGCTSDAADDVLDDVGNFWEVFGVYIMYIMIAIGILIAIYAFKVYSSAYVANTVENVKTRARKSGKYSNGAFYKP